MEEKEVCTVLFADIAKSTTIYNEMGSKKAQKYIGECLSFLTGICENHQGTLIKTIGDEIMVTFPNPNLAAKAAMEMNKSLEEIPLIRKQLPPNIYVGFCAGELVRENGDVFGDTVNMAARLTSRAKPRQILTERKTIKQLNTKNRETSRKIEETNIKGMKGVFSIYEFVWEEDDVTFASDGMFSPTLFSTTLVLNYKKDSITVNRDNPSVTLGRQRHNDLVIDQPNISRTHALVEYRQGKFVLIDKSTNGTYISSGENKAVFVKNEEAPLKDSGVITLGHQSENDAQELITYSIENQS